LPSSCASRPNAAFLRLVFAGTPEFAARALDAVLAAGHDVALVLTQPDRPSGRGLRQSASAVKQLAAARGLAVFQPQNFKSEADIEHVRAARPQALVVAAYGLILPQALLDVAPLGAWNIHASLLPRWRGAAPIQRALLAGDAQTGISIMRMDAGLDTGPVLVEQVVDIAADDDAGTLHERLASLGAQLMVDCLERIPGAPRPQDAEGATYARKITREETHIDWQRPAAEIERAVRAFRPSPGAAARLGSDALKIWRAAVVPARGAPGEVLRAGPELVVACGENALAIEEMQRAGGRPVGAAEFLRGRRLEPGERFA
jgi:methionyl-tRNA formyltransferase